MSVELHLQRQKNVQRIETIILDFIMVLKHFGLLLKNVFWFQGREWI